MEKILLYSDHLKKKSIKQKYNQRGDPNEDLKNSKIFRLFSDLFGHLVRVRTNVRIFGPFGSSEEESTCSGHVTASHITIAFM